MRYTDQDQNKAMILLDPGSVTASTTGNSIDRKHFEALHIIMPIKCSTTGLAAANYVTLSLTHATASDDTFAICDQYVVPGQMQAFSGTTGCDLAVISGTQSTATAVEATIDLKACKQYVSVSATVVGSTAVYEMGVIGILGDTYGYPVTATT